MSRPLINNPIRTSTLDSYNHSWAGPKWVEAQLLFNNGKNAPAKKRKTNRWRIIFVSEAAYKRKKSARAQTKADSMNENLNQKTDASNTTILDANIRSSYHAPVRKLRSSQSDIIL